MQLLAVKLKIFDRLDIKDYIVKKIKFQNPHWHQ